MKDNGFRCVRSGLPQAAALLIARKRYIFQARDSHPNEKSKMIIFSGRHTFIKFWNNLNKTTQILLSPSPRSPWQLSSQPVKEPRARSAGGPAPQQPTGQAAKEPSKLAANQVGS